MAPNGIAVSDAAAGAPELTENDIKNFAPQPPTEDPPELDSEGEEEAGEDATGADSAGGSGPEETTADEQSHTSQPEEETGEVGGGDAEGAAIEKSFGRLTWDLCNRLRCEGCGHTAPAPVRQCPAGHVICPTCAKSLGACPNMGCGLPLGKDPATNAALGAMAERTGITVPCRNKACDWRVRHADLARHERYCMLIRKGLVSPSVGPDVEAPESSPDAVLAEEVRSQLDCSLCNHAAPAPILQCRNGHVACYYCLGRLRKFDDPICPLCSVPLHPGEGEDGGGDGTVVRNAHLEGLASLAGTVVPCRHDGCAEEVEHSRLAEHLRKCEHQPIKCIHCTVTGRGPAARDTTFVSWDAMWEHYREEHLPNYPPTPLDAMVVRAEIVERMMEGKIDFVTWGRCLDPESGEPVRAFPGLFYDEARDVFYFSVRIMGPIAPGDTCGLSVGPFDSDAGTDPPTPQITVEARMPPTSYRVGYFEDADLGTAARTVRERPCLVLSAPTVRCLLELSGGEDGGRLCFRVTLPKGGPSTT